MPSINDSLGPEALLARISCGNASDRDLQLYSLYLQEQIVEGLGGAPSTVTLTTESGSGNIAAGFQSLDISIIAPLYDGSNEETKTITSVTPNIILSNNPDVGRSSLSMSINYKGTELPAVTFSGAGTISWVGLKLP